MMTGTGAIRALTVAFLICSTWAARFDSETFFVDCEHGSDAGGTPGTQSAPFRSPMRARDALLKALYGLRKAPKAYQVWFAKEMKTMGFEQLAADSQIFVHLKLHLFMLLTLE